MYTMLWRYWSQPLHTVINGTAGTSATTIFATLARPYLKSASFSTSMLYLQTQVHAYIPYIPCNAVPCHARPEQSRANKTAGMHACVHTHRCIPTYRPTAYRHRPTDLPTCLPAYINAYIHHMHPDIPFTCLHAYTKTHRQTDIHTYTHTRTHMHAYIHTCMHTYIDAYIHTYENTCRYTSIHKCRQPNIHKYKQT